MKCFLMDIKYLIINLLYIQLAGLKKLGIVTSEVFSVVIGQEIE